MTESSGYRADHTVLESRVLMLPQTSADARAIERLFRANDISSELVVSTAQLHEEIRRGAGTVMVSEEALLAAPMPLTASVTQQAMWSDLPIIVLARSGRESVALSRLLPQLGNVTLLERPIRISTLVSLVRSSLRARFRQYEVRKHLQEQQQAQRVIREGERRYMALLENIADYAIFTTDLQGHISSWNRGAEAVLGYTALEAMGRSAALFLPEEEESLSPAEQMRRAREQGKVETAGWKVDKKGERLYVESVLVAMRDESGDVLGYANFFRDVTDRHRIQSEREQLLDSERAARGEAERASRMKDEFLATLSHELRTPLNSILGWTHVARRNSALTDDIRNALSVIDRNARAQAQIIEDLLDMSSIISGKVRLDVRRVDLATIINTAVDTLRPAAEAKGIRLQVVVDPEAVPIPGDPNRLQQVLWNLLNNAVKFTPRNGRISVALTHVNSHVEVEVTDTGDGIDAAFLPYVFDRFRQADASTARRHGGLGLGLAIVKHLVELHGGTVSVQSPGPSQGTTFRIELPMMATSLEPRREEGERPRPAAEDRQPEPVATYKGRLNGLHVLVVDDESDARSLIRRLLLDSEARVSTARSSEEAISVLEQEAPDVLVSDIGMPGEDGYSMIRRIRQMKAPCATLPAIALTAYARTEDRVRAVQAGYQLHLSKPVEPVELVAMIESLAQRPQRPA